MKTTAKSFIAAVFFCFVPAAAFAGNVEPTEQQSAEYAKAKETVRIKLLIALAKQGQHELADTMLRRYPLTGKYAVNRTLYIQGLILRGRKDNKGAVAKFRAALADDPKLSLVRTDLAETLVDMGEDDSAKHHLQLLEAEAPDAQVASNIRAFIDRIDQNRPLRFNAFMSVAPSTNITNGSSHDTVKVYDPLTGGMKDASVTSKHKSGIGAAIGGNVSYNKSLGQNWAVVLAAGGSARIYKDHSFNSFGLSQSFDVRYMQDKSSIGVGLIANESIKNDLSDIPYYAFGPRVSTSVNVSVRDVITATSIFEKRIYRHATAVNGWASFNDLGWTHSLDSATNVSTTIGFNRIKSGFKPYSYKTWYTGLDLYKELPHGITANLGGQVQYSTFDDYNALGLKFRKDTRAIASIGLVKRDWNMFGFAPSAEYTIVKNFSNLDIYDYNSHNFDFRLTKDF